MLKKILIANRGEIACRIIRTARRMGIATVAVYSDADARAMHVRDADEAIHIGPSPATDSYLDIAKIIAAARSTGADAIHPGYGFLSENADLPDACQKAGIRFIGPSGAAMRALGGKAAAKDIAIKAGVPVVPGYQGKAQDAVTLTREAARIGFPVMIKAVAGGGGRGMRLVTSAAELPELLDSARREAQSAFGNPDVLIEKVVERPRHIEVQVFGDNHGNAVHMFERDCTLQRRNQKVIEEAPAPGMSSTLRQNICDAAVKLAKHVRYAGAGTVEFLVEGGALDDRAKWYFIEMNTRLQVEHPVTEQITGLDLVEWQFRVAAGEPLPLPQDKIKMSGHAIEVRLCAEDPARGFMPSVGDIRWFEVPEGEGVRFETGIGSTGTVSPYYDSMIAKIIVSAPDRAAAIDRMIATLSGTVLLGLRSNARFLRSLLAHPKVRAAAMDTGLIAHELPALIAEPHDATATANGISYLARMTTHTIQRRLQLDPNAPWSTRDGFGLGAPRTNSMAVLIDGKPETATLTWPHDAPGPAVTVGAIHVSARDIARDRGNTQIAGDARGCYILHDLVHREIARPLYDASQIDDGLGSGAVRAPINGRVAKLFVAAGHQVEKGQRVAVVEAMKMEHILVAGASGLVEKVAVAEGAQVNQGALIATIAEQPA